MTTIAYDGRNIAVDSRTSHEWVTQRQVQKMWLNVGRFQCVVVCGSTNCYLPVIQWLRNGADPDQFPSDIDRNFSAWVVEENGDVFRYVDGPARETVDCVDADGSGGKFAMGAMLAGASAIRAVEIAARLDPYTGGDVKYYWIKRPGEAA